MPWTLVAALSTAQLVSWGSLFYAFALIMEPMGRELGWSRPALTAAYSLGLVASGLGAYPVGRLIDLGYGRVVMTAGSLAAALLFALWSQVTHYGVFVAVWIGLGVAMSAVLYEPGFAVLARSLGNFARRGITVMTLVGGLASTVFIPLTHVLIEGFGWRGALLVLAAANLVLCAGVHVAFVPPRLPRKGAETAVPDPNPSGARRVLRETAFWSFVATIVLQGIVSTGIPIHLVPILMERGFTLSAAVAAYSLIGPAQVAARLAVGLGERVLSLKAIGLATMVVWVAAIALLPFVPAGSALVFVFACLYGAANGMTTILRALLPPELFGRADYGAIQGMIATPANFTRAAAPFAFGALWAWWGNYGAVLAMCAAMSAVSLATFVVTIAAARRM
jgi:MFS family permease